jgi:hypothetical protein
LPHRVTTRPRRFVIRDAHVENGIALLQPRVTAPASTCRAAISSVAHVATAFGDVGPPPVSLSVPASSLPAAPGALGLPPSASSLTCSTRSTASCPSAADRARVLRGGGGAHYDGGHGGGALHLGAVTRTTHYLRDARSKVHEMRGRAAVTHPDASASAKSPRGGLGALDRGERQTAWAIELQISRPIVTLSTAC